MKVQDFEIKQVDYVRTGDIMLVSANTFLAEAIQAFQAIGADGYEKLASAFNHAGVFYWDFNVLRIAEATEKGITQADFVKDYMEDNTFTMIMGLRPKITIDEDKAWAWIKGLVGNPRTKYNFFHLLIAYPIYYLSFKKLWIGGKEKAWKHTWCCGEFAASFAEIMEIVQFENCLKTTPADLFLRVEFEHYFLKIRV